MVPKIAPRENICSKAHLFLLLVQNVNISFHWSFHQSGKSLLNAPIVWFELKWVSFPCNFNYIKKVHIEFRHIKNIFKNLSVQHHTLNPLDFKDWIITYHNIIISILMKFFKLSLLKTHVIHAPRVNNPIIWESVRLRVKITNKINFVIILLAFEFVWFFSSFATLFFLFSYSDMIPCDHKC